MPISLLVDTRELRHPVTGGVYVVRIDDAVYVKRLKWSIPKGLYNVISDNPAHKSFEIDHKTGREFKIIGKAIAPIFKRILLSKSTCRQRVAFWLVRGISTEGWRTQLGRIFQITGTK